MNSDVSTAVTIVIGGPPTAKGRPRMTRKGFVYTPAATRKYEAYGRLAAQQAMNGRPPIAVPIRIEISVDLPVPQSWSAKRQEAALRGDIRPTTRPDADNYVKSGSTRSTRSSSPTTASWSSSSPRKDTQASLSSSSR